MSLCVESDGERCSAVFPLRINTHEMMVLRVEIRVVATWRKLSRYMLMCRCSHLQQNIVPLTQIDQEG